MLGILPVSLHQEITLSSVLEFYKFYLLSYSFFLFFFLSVVSERNFVLCGSTREKSVRSGCVLIYCAILFSKIGELDLTLNFEHLMLRYFLITTVELISNVVK